MDSENRRGCIIYLVIILITTILGGVLILGETGQFWDGAIFGLLAGIIIDGVLIYNDQ